MGENNVYIATDRTSVPILGGGSDRTKKTMTEGKVSIGVDGWYYVNSIYASEFGFISNSSARVLISFRC